MGWIIASFIIVIIIIVITVKYYDRASRAAQAKTRGLVKCPKCNGRGYVDVASFDDFATIRCDFCEDSGVPGYVTPEHKGSFNRVKRWFYSILLILFIAFVVWLLMKR